ncbi:hypothetical protein Pcinc_004893 [Petrolisthes cinctipes]|uniref:Uncharacterized protein n=1 Tax=Petrolisthes cinctipes TaxID=88211 RepID=A0AAE1GEJ0_PETCI|nr:hypothetical protein Pcinc_004893 [Petrolisthes cinctipes]
MEIILESAINNSVRIITANYMDDFKTLCWRWKCFAPLTPLPSELHAVFTRSKQTKVPPPSRHHNLETVLCAQSSRGSLFPAISRITGTGTTTSRKRRRSSFYFSTHPKSLRKVVRI